MRKPKKQSRDHAQIAETRMPRRRGGHDLLRGGVQVARNFPVRDCRRARSSFSIYFMVRMLHPSDGELSPPSLVNVAFYFCPCGAIKFIVHSTGSASRFASYVSLSRESAYAARSCDSYRYCTSRL